MQPVSQIGRLRSTRPGPVRIAFAAFTGLIFSLHTGWADARSEIQASLPAGVTILSANASELAAAVAKTIISNTDASITPADLAAAPFLPVTETVKGKPVVKVRSDRDTSAPLVVAAAVAALISGSDASLAEDVGDIVDSVDVVDGTDAAGNLSAGGRAAVVKAGLGAVSDSAVSDGSLLALDQSIGQTLAGDAFLENLPKGGLTTILQNAIAGIYGASGRAQAVAPEAAEAFVQGLLATGVPDGAVPPPFAVAILKNVAKNTNVDELVAYEVGLRDNASSTNLVTLATTLFKAYPAAIVKLAQGITAVTTPGFNNEAERIDYIRDLVAAQAGDAIPVVQGAVFVDPYYAGPFTQGVFTSILTAPKGAKLLVADAPGIAGGVGSVLGQDGSGLTEVAEVFGQFISAGDLPAASAAAYATALIGGAVRSNVPAFTGVAAGGGGGQLNLGAGITAATVTDLAAITDLLANGILTADHASLTGTGLAKAASQVEALAAAAARFTRNEIFDNGNGTSGAVAAFIAGSLADDVAALNLGDNGPASPQQVLFAAIDKAVTAVTNQAVDPAVNAVFKGQDYLNYPVLGAISGPETAVTNL